VREFHLENPFQNVPVEVVLNALPDWPNLIYLKLLDDFGQVNIDYIADKIC